MHRTLTPRWRAARPLFAFTFAAFVPALAHAQTDSDAIIVTASPIAGDPDRFATIVTQVSRDDILQSGGANLADALKDVPGIASTGFAAGASRPVIRGMDSFRVMLLENGLSSSDVSELGPDHGVPIDPLSARDIDVVRGAATLRYGGQAIGGAVNAINNRIPISLPADPLRGEATAGYDTNAATRDGSLLLDGRAGAFAFHADAFARRSSDYDTPDGEQANSFFTGGGYSAGGSYFFGPGQTSRAGLAFTRYNSRYGIPSDDTFIDMHQNKLTAGASLHLGDGLLQTLNLDAAYADYLHHEKAPEGDVLSTFANRETNARAETLLGPIGPLTASALGVQYSDRHFSGAGEASDFLAPTHTETAAVFAFTEAPLPLAGHLQTAVRLERASVSGLPISDLASSREFTPVSASLGALFDVTDALKLGLTLSSAARAPGQVELYARGPHDGPATFEIGDPNLDIERANSLETTLRYRTNRFKLEAALWDARFSNYIYGALTGALCNEAGDCANPADADLQQLFYRQRDANFWGAEAHLTYDLVNTSAGAWQAVALADTVRADFSHEGGPVPRIQPYRLGAGLNWSSTPFDAGFMLTYVGRQQRVPDGDTPTKGYVSLDANIAWRPSFADNLEIALAGHNLTDTVQRNAVAINRDAVELPGRDVRIVLRQSF